MKLKQLIESVPSIQELIKEPLPVKTSFKLSTFISKMNPEIEAFDKVKKDKIIEYKGERQKDENGREINTFKIPDENVEKFSKEIKELLEQEVDIDVPDINIEDLGDIKIKPEFLMGLNWLIK
jgi:hypothetical protein